MKAAIITFPDEQPAPRVSQIVYSVAGMEAPNEYLSALTPARTQWIGAVGMPLVLFDSLPDDARVWVFGSAKPLEAQDERTLLKDVDDYLAGWKAHGHPLP